MFSQHHNHNNLTDGNFNGQQHELSSYIGLHAGVNSTTPPSASPGASSKTQCSLQAIMCSPAFALDTTVITHQWQRLEQSHKEQREQRKSLKGHHYYQKGFERAAVVFNESTRIHEREESPEDSCSTCLLILSTFFPPDANILSPIKKKDELAKVCLLYLLCVEFFFTVVKRGPFYEIIGCVLQIELLELYSIYIAHPHRWESAKQG